MTVKGDMDMDTTDDVRDGLSEIADALRLLGNADAATSFGGLEALGMVHKEALEALGGGAQRGAGRHLAELG
jgi:hypothetical protein